MSILETNTVDGIGISEDGFSAALLADHLDWSDEYAHLVLLQDKLNAYFGFIESGQLKARLPRRRMKRCTIEIRFHCTPTEKAVQFLQAAQKQADKLKPRFDIRSWRKHETAQKRIRTGNQTGRRTADRNCNFHGRRI